MRIIHALLEIRIHIVLGGRKEGVAIQLANLGVIEKTRGNLEAARRNWTQSHDLYAEIGMPHMTAKIQSWLDTLHDQK